MAAQITQAEINELKSIFEQKIGNYSVTFNKDENGNEDFSVYDGYSGEDAFWSGSIVLEQDYYVKWQFSLKNGATITESTFRINEQNKNIISEIYDIYNIWSDKLSKYIRGEESMPTNKEEEKLENEEESLAESRTIEGRKKNIDESYERMKKLSGL
jgi:hypothetical protein